MVILKIYTIAYLNSAWNGSEGVFDGLHVVHVAPEQAARWVRQSSWRCGPLCRPIWHTCPFQVVFARVPTSVLVTVVPHRVLATLRRPFPGAQGLATNQGCDNHLTSVCTMHRAESSTRLPIRRFLRRGEDTPLRV